MMQTVTLQVLPAVLAHAGREQPRECCGLLVRLADGVGYWPARNRCPLPGQFELHPEDFADAEDAGEIVAVVHSHVHEGAAPSQADRLGCEASGLPWLIVSWPHGGWRWLAPSGFALPWVGREFVWGITDCFTLVRDYYRQELGILVDCPEPYDYNFWQRGADLYGRYQDFGFARLPDGAQPQPHDVLLMQVRSPVANHAAVYLGGGVMLHHLEKRLSERVQYGGFWAEATLVMVRHESLFHV